MFYKLKKKILLTSIKKAKLAKVRDEVKARIMDKKLNEKIAMKEELNQLAFNLKRLKSTPKNQAEARARAMLVKDTIVLTKKLGRGVGLTADKVIKILFALGGGNVIVKKAVKRKVAKRVIKKVVKRKIAKKIIKKAVKRKIVKKAKKR